MTIKQRQNMLSEMRVRHHKQCPVCSDFNTNGLRIEFRACAAEGVEAEVVLGKDKEGYCGHIHGGVIASLLDGAMTNCLFSHGIRAVTGELIVRMIHPLQAGKTMVVQAHLERRLSPLYVLSAKLLQERRVAAKGKAKFVTTNLPGECQGSTMRRIE